MVGRAWPLRLEHSSGRDCGNCGDLPASGGAGTAAGISGRLPGVAGCWLRYAHAVPAMLPITLSVPSISAWSIGKVRLSRRITVFTSCTAGRAVRPANDMWGHQAARAGRGVAAARGDALQAEGA